MLKCSCPKINRTFIFEISRCELSDWEEKPKRLLRIRNKKQRKFALEINHIWKNLCRSVKKEVTYFKKKELTISTIEELKFFFDFIGSNFIPSN